MILETIQVWTNVADRTTNVHFSLNRGLQNTDTGTGVHIQYLNVVATGLSVSVFRISIRGKQVKWKRSFSISLILHALSWK